MIAGEDARVPIVGCKVTKNVVKFQLYFTIFSDRCIFLNHVAVFIDYDVVYKNHVMDYIDCVVV